MKPRHPVIVATIWMAGTLISFMALAIGGRELSAHLNTFQILFFRAVIGLIAVAPLMSRIGWRKARSPLFGTHVIRNMAHFAGQFGWFYGLAYIPLAEVFAIEFTVPIWTAILAVPLLREPLTRSRILAVALGFTGMLVILRPGWSVVQPAALAVLAGAVCFGLSHSLTRKLALVDSPVVILLYMALLQLPLGLFLSLPDWRTPPPSAYPWLLVVGLTAMSAHYCMARALALADATVVVPMDFLRLPLIALVGFLFYDEALDMFVLTGAVVMLAGNIVNIRAERAKASRRSANIIPDESPATPVPSSGIAISDQPLE